MKDDVDIPQTKDVNIPSKNNNQPSIPVKVHPNKVSNQSFNSETVKDHVLTNNKDFGIPNKKNVDIPKKIDADIPQNKYVNIPSKNNNGGPFLSPRANLCIFHFSFDPN